MIEAPLDFAEGILISGFRKPWKLPPLPWVMVAGLAAVLGWWIGGWRMSLLAGGCFVLLRPVRQVEAVDADVVDGHGGGARGRGGRSRAGSRGLQVAALRAAS